MIDDDARPRYRVAHLSEMFARAQPDEPALVARALVPYFAPIRSFYGAMCLALLLVTYIPAISLWLLGLMR
jgi:hypothetical protein